VKDFHGVRPSQPPRPRVMQGLAARSAGNQAIIGVHRTIAPLGPARLVIRPLNPKPPLLEGRLAIGLEALGGSDGSGKPDWLECRNEGARDRLVDLDAADVEAVAAATVDEVFAAAMVPGSRIPPAIMRALPDGCGWPAPTTVTHPLRSTGITQREEPHLATGGGGLPAVARAG
jgi:hypothetical protein